MAGPIALVGSGEFLDAMGKVDEELLDGRAPRAVFLPTAAAEDGAERVQYWIDLGNAHFSSLGIEPVALPVLDRSDADNPRLAELVAGAGLVYLSGGNPGYLADTLRDTLVWRAVLDAWLAGAALAGCSAGACALSAIADDFRQPGRFSGAGLGVVGHVATIPHFDRFSRIAPGLAADLLASAPPDVAVVGIDEETALVGGPDRWRVAGRGAVWLLARDGSRSRFAPDDEILIERPAQP